MGSLEEVQDNWESFALTDPMWAALMDPEKEGGAWEVDDFLAIGEKEIDTVCGYLAAAGIEVDTSGKALDFGCGMGRLTQALARRFSFAYGVDIAPTMVKLAREVNRHPERCDFLLNEADDLSLFDAGTFAFIYTSVVLQHMDPRYSSAYIREFSRILAPGGVMVFQVPDRVEPGGSRRERLSHLVHQTRSKLGLRTRARRTLRRLGLRRAASGAPDAVAELHCLPEPEVAELLRRNGVELVDVALTNANDTAYVPGAQDERQSLYAIGGLRYRDAPPTVGFVSKQYCGIKRGDAASA